jgi:hypothetical protein
MPEYNDSDYLDMIQDLMSGIEWSTEMLNDIADIIRLSGREVADVE